MIFCCQAGKSFLPTVLGQLKMFLKFLFGNCSTSWGRSVSGGISVYRVDMNSERVKSHLESNLNKLPNQAKESYFGSKPK